MHKEFGGRCLLNNNQKPLSLMCRHRGITRNNTREMMLREKCGAELHSILFFNLRSPLMWQQGAPRRLCHPGSILGL